MTQWELELPSTTCSEFRRRLFGIQIEVKFPTEFKYYQTTTMCKITEIFQLKEAWPNVKNGLRKCYRGQNSNSLGFWYMYNLYRFVFRYNSNISTSSGYAISKILRKV